jgi:hypothetical protein
VTGGREQNQTVLANAGACPTVDSLFADNPGSKELVVTRR